MPVDGGGCGEARGPAHGGGGMSAPMLQLHPIVAAETAQRPAARFSIRVRFDDGRPDFTGHYRSVEERDRSMAAARRIPGFAKVETIDP